MRIDSAEPAGIEAGNPVGRGSETEVRAQEVLQKMRNSTIWVGLGAALLLGAGGCATKGFVRTQMTDVRSDMEQMEGRLKGADQQNGDLA